MYRVAVIEDEDIIRKGLVYSVPWLELGCTVVAEARNGIEGLEVIREYRPDLLLVDINMPIMDGLEMIQKTYREYEYAAIILSGYSTFEYAQKAIRYGVLDYLLKPLDMAELKDVVMKAQKQLDLCRLYLERQKSREDWKKVTLFGETPNLESEPVVQDMLRYIEEHYVEKVLMRDVALKLNYSEVYLNRKFKEIMGTTFIEYLNRCRIQKALDMIREGKMKIQDISWKCGVGEYKYFNIVFRKYLGCTPKEYAQMVRSQEERS